MKKTPSHKGSVITEPASSGNGHVERKFNKLKLLGKGGFAEVWSVVDKSSGEKVALKIIDKSGLKRVMKMKLNTEIKIHAKIDHENVCKFHRYFQNKTHVFLVLELCPCLSLSHLQKDRIKLTELEAKYFLYQLLNGLLHLHKKRVIHRDLKIQNLFLDKNLTLKIGDFGLAAQLAYDGERKTTMCGTINYISPEVLTSAPQGHSYPADMWAVGVILFTLLVGKPPFETMSMKTTCKYIRNGFFHFPSFSKVSPAAQNLITWMLQKDPKKRPTPLDALEHSFFVNEKKDYINCPMTLNYYAFSHVRKFPEKVLLKRKNGIIGRLKEANVVVVGRKESKRKPFGEVKASRPRNKNMYYKNARLNGIDDGDPNKENRHVKPRYIKKIHEKLEKSVCTLEKRLALEPKKRTGVKENMLGKVFESPKKFHVMPNGQKFRGFRRLKHSPRVPLSPLPRYRPPRIFVKDYLDVTSKYGLAYRYNTGMIGAFFNDQTMMLFNPDTLRIRYFTRITSGNYKEEKHTAVRFPDSLKKKVRLIEFFYDNFRNKYGAIINVSDTDVFMKMFVKQGNTYVFRLSNRTVQVRFVDKSQVILSKEAKIVTYTDKYGVTKTFPLEEVGECGDSSLAKRLRYTKNILHTLIKNSEQRVF